MFKNKIYLYIFALLISISCLHVVTSASEQEKDLGVSKSKNIAKIIKPSDVANVDLKQMKKVAVLITSTLPLFGEVAEDQLMIKLRDMGLDVIQRSKITDLTQKELMREEVRTLEEELKIYKEQLEFEKQLEKEDESIRGLKRLEKQAEQIAAQIERMKESSQKENLNIVEIGQKLGLDTAIVGTLFEGKRQISFSEDKSPSAMEKIVVSTFYLQIIDIKSDKVILAMMLEYDKGESVMNAVDAVTNIIKEERKSKWF